MTNWKEAFVIVQVIYNGFQLQIDILMFHIGCSLIWQAKIPRAKQFMSKKSLSAWCGDETFTIGFSRSEIWTHFCHYSIRFCIYTNVSRTQKEGWDFLATWMIFSIVNRKKSVSWRLLVPKISIFFSGCRTKLCLRDRKYDECDWIKAHHCHQICER